MIIYQILKDLSQVYPSFAMKTYYFHAITFSFWKKQIKYFINKNNYISEVFKKLWSATNKKKVPKWALDSAIILSLSLFHFYDFQGFY